MKKIIYSVAVIVAMASFTKSAMAQLTDEKNVTINVDLQPVLQLDMTTPDHLDFTFSKISDYVGGITKYGATQLRVSSSVSWYLYAVGTSQAAQGGLGAIMDNQAQYLEGAAAGVQGLPIISLDALELYQAQGNFANGVANVSPLDYSSPFTSGSVIAAAGPGGFTSTNSIDASLSATPYNFAVAPVKYVEGNAGAPANGGSYLTSLSANSVLGAATTAGTDQYVFNIDYRLLPGLPVIFPASPTTFGLLGGAGFYTSPGAYTMDVKYILLQAL